ncbi:transcriptional regulator, XRE family [Paenibacillus curdlanolyticus YK9]|uniref:Transcriptional regulator, XRE family n=1 Tax=Paenibacillus curdlanolyticus YK9 TaxID=717606 RepID=E0I4K5_9BACL|nr:helix-turn-helix transcriptional regulator [Paenibacillus curdlanolyticus]EFM12536.1 transcriptional regulator, XRE family [Paenibacillus curdlanolyticus YK9]
MSNVLELVGARIREIRKSKGLTQDQLAEISQFHYSYIGGVERGERNVSLENLAKIADALQVKLSLFFDYEEPKSSAVDSELDEIIYLLSKRDVKQIRMVKNIMLEIFDQLPLNREE